VREIRYDNDNVIISETSLYFYGITLGLDNVETAYFYREPRRSLFVGIKEWFYILIVVVIVCNIWRELMPFGDLYCYSFPLLVVFNVYMFFQKYYRLVVRTTSGFEHSTINKSYKFVEEVKTAINKAREEYIRNNTANVIVNNGIISSGNNNKNKIINKNNTVNNYRKIEKELRVLVSHVSDNDKKVVKEAISVVKENDDTKLKKCLSKLGKGTLTIIKDLGLIVLEKYIETMF